MSKLADAALEWAFVSRGAEPDGLINGIDRVSAAEKREIVAAVQELRHVFPDYITTDGVESVVRQVRVADRTAFDYLSNLRSGGFSFNGDNFGIIMPAFEGEPFQRILLSRDVFAMKTGGTRQSLKHELLHWFTHDRFHEIFHRPLSEGLASLNEGFTQYLTWLSENSGDQSLAATIKAALEIDLQSGRETLYSYPTEAIVAENIAINVGREVCERAYFTGAAEDIGAILTTFTHLEDSIDFDYYPDYASWTPRFTVILALMTSNRGGSWPLALFGRDRISAWLPLSALILVLWRLFSPFRRHAGTLRP